MTTIVIADDHPIVRKGLATILDSDPDYDVVGEAEDGIQAVEMVERLRPDVLVVDVMMPGLGGLEVTRRVTHTTPQTRVVVLSMHANEPYVLEALRSGASAYVLKATSTESLVAALREVMAGRRYLSPPLTERAINVYLERANSAVAEIDPYDMLTGREREVLHMAAHSHTNAEIATRLSISPRTAETHRTNLMRKLGLRTQTALIKYALQRGIIDNAQ